MGINRLSGSTKVIGTDKDRLATYDLMLWVYLEIKGDI